MTVSTSNKKKECCAIQVMKDQGMSTSYTILLFSILYTVLLWKQPLEVFWTELLNLNYS